MNKKQSGTKALTWRIVASTDTFLIAFVCSQILGMDGLHLASAIALFEIPNKLIIYYLHERAWVFFPTMFSKRTKRVRG